MVAMLRRISTFLHGWVKGRDNLKKALHNTGWLFFDRVVRMAVGLWVGVWLARYLGPGQFGTLNYAIAFVSLFGSFVTLGLDSIVVRELVRNPDSREEILGTAFSLRSITGVATLLVMMVIIRQVRPDDVVMRQMIGILGIGFIFQSFDTCDLLFQAQVCSKYTVYAKGSAFLMVALLKIFLIVSSAPLMAFVWASLGETMLGGVGLLLSYSRSGQSFFKWHWRSGRAIVMLKDSWPLLLSMFAVIFYMKIDVIMLGEMKGSEAVGNYSAALKFSEIWHFVPAIIITSVFPAIIEAKKIDERLYMHRLQRLHDFLTWSGLVIAIVISFSSSYIISFFYGDQYRGADGILTIHVWSAVFVFLGMASGQYLVIENLTRIILVRCGLGAFVNISLNFFLIPAYGAIGAAITTLVTHIVINLVTVFFRRSRGCLVLYLNSLNLLRIFNRTRREVVT